MLGALTVLNRILSPLAAKNLDESLVSSPTAYRRRGTERRNECAPMQVQHASRIKPVAGSMLDKGPGMGASQTLKPILRRELDLFGDNLAPTPTGKTWSLGL